MRRASCPRVNQIECTCTLPRTACAFDTAFGIATEAWSPIAQGKALATTQSLSRSPRKSVRLCAGDSSLVQARRYRLFRSRLSRSRVEENFAIFDFELSDDDYPVDHRTRSTRAHGPDPTPSTTSLKKRERGPTLVLAGGGIAGIAWGRWVCPRDRRERTGGRCASPGARTIDVHRHLRRFRRGLPRSPGGSACCSTSS
jgi:hypothetical protein